MATFVRHRTKPELGIGLRDDSRSSDRHWIIAFPKERRFDPGELMVVPESQVTEADRRRLGPPPPPPQNVRDALIARGVASVHHSTPLHHLPAILTQRRLASKETLRREGRHNTHFRRTSWQTDEGRGFGRCVHLSCAERFALLDAKLDARIPHVRLSLPTAQLPPDVFITPWNIGRNRQGTELPQTAEDGAWLHGFEIRVGHTPEHVGPMLSRGRPIEVLVFDEVSLRPTVEVTAFDAAEHETLCALFNALKVEVPVRLEAAGYTRANDGAWLAYLQRCIDAGRALPPPELDFD